MTEKKETVGAATGPAAMERRAALKKIGRFAAVSAPAVTLLLAARSKPAKAAPISMFSSRQFKTQGLAVNSTAVLAVLTAGGSVGVIDPIDGVGLCLAAIKALAGRIGGLELRVAAI